MVKTPHLEQNNPKLTRPSKLLRGEVVGGSLSHSCNKLSYREMFSVSRGEVQSSLDAVL